MFSDTESPCDQARSSFQVECFRKAVMTDEAAIADPFQMSRALLDNADALLEDSALLLANGRHARAAALAVVASEELGKLYHCLMSITGEAPLPPARSKPWTDHKDKLSTMVALELAFMDEGELTDPKGARDAVAHLQRLKNACFYVDHSAGRIVSPAEVDTGAADQLTRVKAQRDFLRKAFANVTPENMDAVRPFQRGFEQLLESLVVEEDLVATRRRLRAVLEAAQSGDDQTLRRALNAALAEVAVVREVVGPESGLRSDGHSTRPVGGSEPVG